MINAAVETASEDDILAEFCRLASDQSQGSLASLDEYLAIDWHSRLKETSPRKIKNDRERLITHCTRLALLQRGPEGIKLMVNELSRENFAVRRVRPDVLAALWWAAKGQIAPEPTLLQLPGLMVPLPRPMELGRALSPECIQAARQAINQIVIEARSNRRLFEHVFSFLMFYSDSGIDEIEPGNCVSIDDCYEIMTSGAIKLSRGLIKEFSDLIEREDREEEYQKFLAQHPVFLDPLASEVIPKQKLGIETVTDFALRRYDGKYTLVEIEKPQDRLFTSANDFTAQFTHALGQVLDFQQWVDTHAEYARSHLPGISSPRGLLVMGRRSYLLGENVAKLHRFVSNSSTIDVVTYDDLVGNATNIYEAIVRKGLAVSGADNR